MAFNFKLEHADGTPADPPTIQSAVPNWGPGDMIPLGPDKPALRVVELRPAKDEGESGVLVVEAA